MPPIDRARIEAAVAEILEAIGEDAQRPGLLTTPQRVAESYTEFFAGVGVDPVPLLSDEVEMQTDPGERGELVLLRDIPFQALCEHHLLPFRGVVHVGYLPGARIVGVSLPVRVVDHFARGLQLQERLTEEVADWLGAHLDARGVGVVVEAEHLCMSFRGIGTSATTLRTSAFRGELERLPS